MRKIIKGSLVVIASTLLLSGCNLFQNQWGEMMSNWNGRNVTIRTYDADAEQIDSITGKGVKIQPDKKFDVFSGNETYEKGSVLSITVGRQVIHHVGSSLVANESGLEPLDIDYGKISISSEAAGVPYLSHIQAELANKYQGRKKIIMVRSQTGKPLAIYGGDRVSIFAPKDIKNATVLQIDGKYLFLYRTDYTIYDAKLLIN